MPKDGLELKSVPGCKLGEPDPRAVTVTSRPGIDTSTGATPRSTSTTRVVLSTRRSFGERAWAALGLSFLAWLSLTAAVGSRPSRSARIGFGAAARRVAPLDVRTDCVLEDLGHRDRTFWRHYAR